MNNAALIHEDMLKRARFWEKAIDLADIIAVGLRCHYVATHHAVPLMIGRRNGLIVNVSFYGGARMHDPAYYACKAGLDAFAATASADLATVGLAIVSLWPGIVSTERVQGLAEVIPELKAQLPTFESPEFVGRVIAALHADPALSSLSGKTLIAAELAHRYQLKDTGGREPSRSVACSACPTRRTTSIPGRRSDPVPRQSRSNLPGNLLHASLSGRLVGSRRRAR